VAELMETMEIEIPCVAVTPEAGPIPEYESVGDAAAGLTAPAGVVAVYVAAAGEVAPVPPPLPPSYVPVAPTTGTLESVFWKRLGLLKSRVG